MSQWRVSATMTEWAVNRMPSALTQTFCKRKDEELVHNGSSCSKRAWESSINIQQGVCLRKGSVSATSSEASSCNLPASNDCVQWLALCISYLGLYNRNRTHPPLAQWLPAPHICWTFLRNSKIYFFESYLYTEYLWLGFTKDADTKVWRNDINNRI